MITPTGAPAWLHTKIKGDIAELRVAARLLETGRHVLKPFGDCTRYDLVIDDDGRFYRVQVKTAQWYGDDEAVIVFPSCSASSPTNGPKRGYHGEADYFGVFFPPLSKVYLVPVSECGATEVKLRLKPAKNNQLKGTRYAAQYEI